MERKHAPSQKKLRDAKNQGQVAKSQDVLKVVSLVVAFELFTWLGQNFLLVFGQMNASITSSFVQSFETSLQNALVQSIFLISVVVLGVAFLISLIKILVSWLQSGFVVAPAKAAPSLERVSPARQLSQMFSAAKWWELFSSIVKVVVLVLVGWLLLKGVILDFFQFSRLDPNQVWSALDAAFSPVIRSLLLILVVISGVDYWVQRRLMLRQLRMSDEEMKRERKSQDGDPLMKSKRKSLARELLETPQSSGMDAVQEADVVVVNPTHIAIVLSYKPERQPLPVVVYKAQDEQAMATIEFARSVNVPVIRYLWLARALHQTTPVGGVIPRETIQATATLFRVLKQLSEAEDSGTADIPEISHTA